MSYNKLQFEEQKPHDVIKPVEPWEHQAVHSNGFMENIESFLKYAQFLNHIDFSGMNLPPDKIRLLLRLF